MGAVIIFKLISPSTPATGGMDGKTIKNITAATFTKNPLQGIVGRMEFSVEGEMRSLGKSVKSAAGHLYSCLDIKIGAKNKKRSSG